MKEQMSERENENIGYEPNSVSTHIRSKWDTDLKFSREMTLVVSISERLIVWIVASSVPAGKACSILCSSSLPLHSGVIFPLSLFCLDLMAQKDRNNFFCAKHLIFTTEGICVHVCQCWLSRQRPCRIHISWLSVSLPLCWPSKWDLELGTRNAAAIFITEFESVLKPNQIVCHLFKGRRCFLNRPERAWTKELRNCGDFSVYEGWPRNNAAHFHT